MIRTVRFGLYEMCKIPKHEKKHARVLSHWSNRLPKQVIVTRRDIQMDNGIMNVVQSKVCMFHEYQGGNESRDIIMEENRFMRVYRFVTKNVTTYIEKREEALLLGVVVKKTKARIK